MRPFLFLFVCVSGKPPASGSNLQDLPETASPDSASSTTHATSTSSGAQAAVTASRNNRRRRRDRASDQAAMDSARPCRTSIKSHRGDWRSELRTNCLKRVKKDRISLLWKIRAQGRLPANDMQKVESAVRTIISDEIEKLKLSNEGQKDQEIDMIWEYQGPQAAKPAEIESEDVLLEMERLLYEDLREELIRKELEALDEEDAYLAQAVFDHMQLNDNGATDNAKVWCPVCKQGELRDTYNVIYCTLCELRLDLGEDKITLGYLRERLANAHAEHFDRGCKSAPKFCLQTMFGLTALYMQCVECGTFDVVV